MSYQTFSATVDHFPILSHDSNRHTPSVFAPAHALLSLVTCTSHYLRPQTYLPQPKIKTARLIRDFDASRICFYQGRLGIFLEL